MLIIIIMLVGGVGGPAACTAVIMLAARDEIRPGPNWPVRLFSNRLPDRARQRTVTAYRSIPHGRPPS
jgi:hypothetical protein